jgi:hypothetical protein
MKKEQSVEMQAKVFAFDLNNCAREFGFKPGEVWEINLATQAEKIAVQKDFYPTVVCKVLPDDSSALFGLVKTQIPFVTTAIERSKEDQNLPENALQYLIAFIPNRKRE